MRLAPFSAPLLVLASSLVSSFAATEASADSSPVAAPASADALAPPESPVAPIAPAASVTPPPITAPAKAKKRKKPAAKSKLVARKLVARERLPERGLSFSTGFPLRWANEDGAFSLSYGFSRHFAVRANVASYEAHGPFSFESEISVSGNNRDAGLGFVWYPRSLWSGPTFELGVFARDRDVKLSDFWAHDNRQRVITDTAIYAGRGLIGWSWYWDPFFLSVAAGFSIGHERGTETSSGDLREMVVEKRVRRTTSEAETYFRVGFAFGT